jgi:three-Cys-motif partner protein
VSPSLIGKDGLRVRHNGQYAKLKLDFLDMYLPSALNATQRKPRRAYIDLFAGPGRNSDGHVEFEGGALRALQAIGRGSSTSFTDAVLVNLDQADHAALSERVARLCTSGLSRVPLDRVGRLLGDANVMIEEIVSRFHPRDYLLVFADIEAPKQLPFATLQRLKARHQSVDLYVLFPLEMALKRLVAYNPRRREQWAPTLDAFFGCEDWGGLADQLRANPDRKADLGRALTELYCRQLRTLWEDATPTVDVFLRRRQRLYRMIFAASHEAARRIRTHIQKLIAADTVSGQGSLF